MLTLTIRDPLSGVEIVYHPAETDPLGIAYRVHERVMLCALGMGLDVIVGDAEGTSTMRACEPGGRALHVVPNCSASRPLGPRNAHTRTSAALARRVLRGL